MEATQVTDPSRSPLPASEAFRTHAEVSADGEIQVSLISLPGYYVYLDSISLEGEGFVLEGLKKPEGEQVVDANFGLTQVVRGTAVVSSHVVSRSGESGELHVHFQGCLEDSVCYLPESRSLSVKIPAFVPVVGAPANRSEQADLHASHAHASMAKDQQLASLLGERHPVVALGVFLGLGILLGLTPCVLPMVPVVLGMVAGAKASGKRTTVLAGTYVMAHAIVFAILGMAAAWVGSNLMAYFQGVWAIIPLAVVMVGMGVALLMGARIQIPGFVQAWAGSKGEGGSIPGAAIMGGLSSLIIGPCVAPPLAAVVFYLAHEGNPWLGAGAFFALGIGMGVPMLAAAVGFRNILGLIQGMGQWLTWGMGISLVALGAWLATRVAPVSIVAGVVAALMLVLTVYSLRHSNLKPASGWSTIHRQSWAYSLGALLAFAVVLMPSTEPSPSAFSDIVASHDFEKALEQAETEGKTVVVDFHADWCTSCVEMERTTFSEESVQKRIYEGGFAPFKIDVTKNSPADRELMRSFGLVGPPAVLFFENGEEIRHLRLIGVESEESFLERLYSAQCPLQEQAEAEERTPDRAAC